MSRMTTDIISLYPQMSTHNHSEIFLKTPNFPAIYLQGMRGAGKSASGERICEIYYLDRYLILDWWASIDLENLFWCVPGKLDKDRKKDPYAREVGYPVLIIKPKATLLEPRNPLCCCGIPLADHNPQTKCQHPRPLIETVDDDAPLKTILRKAWRERRVCIFNPGLYEDERDAITTLAKFLQELIELVKQGVIPTHVSMVLFLREMGNIVPQGLQNWGRGLETKVKRALQRLVREARHFRIILLGDFQRSADIAGAIVAQRDYFIFKRITRDLIPDPYAWLYDAILNRRTRAYDSMDFATYYSLPTLSSLAPHQAIAVWPDNYWKLIELRMAGFKHKKPNDSWVQLAHVILKFLDPKKIEKKKSEELRKKELAAEERLKKLKQIHLLKQQDKDWPFMVVEVKWEGCQVFNKPEPATEQERLIWKKEKHAVVANAQMAYNRARTRGLLDPSALVGANVNSVVSDTG